MDCRKAYKLNALIPKLLLSLVQIGDAQHNCLKLVILIKSL